MSSHFTETKKRRQGEIRDLLSMVWMNRITAHSDASHLLFCSCCWKAAGSHHLPQYIQRGFFSHQLLQASALQDLSSQQELQKRADLCCLPLLSTSPLSSSPALPVTPQPSLHQRAGRIPVHTEGPRCSTYSQITWSINPGASTGLLYQSDTTDINQDQALL